MRIFRNCLFEGWVDTRVFRFFTGHASDMTVQPVRSFLAFHRYTCSFIKTSWPKPSNAHVFSVDAEPNTLSLEGCTYANAQGPCTTRPGYTAGTWSGWAAAASPLGFQTTGTNWAAQRYAKFLQKMYIFMPSWQELTLVLPLTFTSGLSRWWVPRAKYYCKCTEPNLVLQLQLLINLPFFI